LKKGDFQDFELWREMNYKMLKLISDNFDGIIIVPMTLVNPVYYGEIIGRLIFDGIEVKHYILYAGRDVIKRRINKRTLPFAGRDAFAVDAIDRCINFFDNQIKDVKIYTDNMSVDDVVDKIADLSNLQLSPNKKTGFGKFIFRTKIMLKHIR